MELCLAPAGHAQAAAETYCRLVEVGPTHRSCWWPVGEMCPFSHRFPL